MKGALLALVLLGTGCVSQSRYEAWGAVALVVACRVLAPTWFSLQQPLFVFGWMIALLFFAGARRAWRASWMLPLGIYLFLQAAWLFKGALGSARYYESLVPFVAIAAAHGVDRLSANRRWVASSIFAAAFVQLAILSSRTLPRWSPGGANDAGRVFRQAEPPCPTTLTIRTSPSRSCAQSGISITASSRSPSGCALASA